MAAKQFTNSDVSHWSWTDTDFYEGTKQALIEAGVCKPEWFPAGPVPHEYQKGKIKRTFLIPGPYGEIELRHKQPYERNYWIASFPCSEKERKQREVERQERLARRDAELEQREMAEHAREEEKARERFEKLVRTLPPFNPGSMSEGEKHFMRLYRWISEEHKQHVLFLAETFLLKGAGIDTLPPVVDVGERPTTRPTTKLSLVVDNGERP